MESKIFLLLLFHFILPTYQNSVPNFLHVYSDSSDLIRKPILINSHDDHHNRRLKRDLPTNFNADANNDKNIIPKLNALNDSHAQLMVHWLGERTDVMICLARDPPLSPLEDPNTTPPPSPSTIFISYDYGNTFLDKTESFQLKKDDTLINSTVDQFMTHPKFNTIVFTDPSNSAIFMSNDYGKSIQSQLLDFKPSEVSFYEGDAQTFLVLDKDDPERKLYYTTDFGKSFNYLQSFVKSFVWSSGEGNPTHLYVERKEPMNTSSVIFIDAKNLVNDGPKKFNLLIENVQDFYIKKDFMLATQKDLNNTRLLISYKRGSFVKAEFQTELDIKGLHIADVEGKRILISVVHNEKISHLYVSESNTNMTDIKFVPSLENIFTFVPDLNWRSSWLVHTSDEAFTELYKVEGLRGIYIASKINRMPQTESIAPDNLASVITFDHGATWQPIIAPSADDEGQVINCKDCTLHLSQKFSQLYPVTRAVTIMSSKSAPGVIMATGVVGKSLKGHPGVFISRDAGLTWKQILKNYHFFNMGDHGGILVAVKYYKSKGETREILYSTDEGDKWANYTFHTNDLKVYGLMTEPNTNTTIFTLFGSEPSAHRWLIIKIDLKPAFTTNCTEDDYKFWTPKSHTGDSFLPCVMGMQETYQRRKAHANCHNGLDYRRPIRKEVCQCNSWDFECDFGFSRNTTKGGCVRNRTVTTYDPYAIPASCKPGGFYNRTKGYRKIEGDVCIDGYSSLYLPQQIPCPFEKTSEFLVVAQRDRISRINLADGVTEVFPIHGLKNVIAIEFDLKHNCVFWADIMTDVIGRQCLNGNQSAEILVETGLASVEGMSYDWISEMLYFVDGMRLKIEAIQTSNSSNGRLRRTVIPSSKLVKPRGIVVHPLAGYLFWTDWSTTNPSVSRATLDGENKKELFTSPVVHWPNGITLDYISERIYWVDASKDYIGSSDLDGKNFIKVLSNDPRVEHPFAVGVFKDFMYWDDWKMNSVFSADKDRGIMIRTIAEEMLNLMDLKIYAHSIQEGANACINGAGVNKCSHMCVGAPKNGYKCVCPDGMHLNEKTGECLCPGDSKPFANHTCNQDHNTCAPNFFTCNNKLCVPLLYHCDGEDDCGDRSDEVGCTMNKPACPPHMFTCKSDGQCIPEYFTCDFDKDCMDGSDEENCKPTKCKESEFTCENKRCISMKWVCDGENDCRDGSDEKTCGIKNGTIECKEDEFRCLSNGVCIPNQWRCDTDNDCADLSDEKNCNDTKTCEPWMFPCGDGRCIYKTWTCDGEPDCTDESDEKNCTTTATPNNKKPGGNFGPGDKCHDWMFHCENNKCIPSWWKCDGVNDCGDNSDEQGCTNSANDPTMTTTTTPKPKPNAHKCEYNYFRCDNGACIPKRYVCDGHADCENNEDEVNCPGMRSPCSPNEFRCRSNGMCLPMEKYCDNIKHCPDGSDEECTFKPNSTIISNNDCKNKPGLFFCDNTCFPLMKKCDGLLDCYDSSDETDCQKVQRVYQVVQIGVDERTLNSTSFLIYWWIAVPQNLTFEFMPSIYNQSRWRNVTEWTEKNNYLFKNLRPFTLYNVTVYVRIKGTTKVFPPYLFYEVATAEGIPSEPLNVSAVQTNGSRIQVNWNAPHEANGHLDGYTVYYRPQSKNVNKAQSIRVSAMELSIVIESDFKGNTTYEIWVKARNRREESAASKMFQLTFDGTSNIDNVSNLRLINQTDDAFTLVWDEIQKCDGYIVQLVLHHPYPKIEPIKVTKPIATLTKVVNGAQYVARVSAYVKNYVGRPQSLVIRRTGEPLPEIGGIATKMEGDNIRITWDKPAYRNINKFTYGIYYGTNLEELFDYPKNQTDEQSFLLTNLLACQSYLIAIGIVGPIGPGPLGKNPRTIETMYSERKPPKNLQAEIDEENLKLHVSWEHSCPLKANNKFPDYVITLRELAPNRTTKVVVKSSGNQTLGHVFEGIPLGAKYEISVGTNTANSAPAYISVNAPPLPAPSLVKVVPAKNGTFIVIWQEMEKELKKTIRTNYTYEAIVISGQAAHFEDKPVAVVESVTPPIFIHPSHLGGESSAGKTFTIGLRLKTNQGRVSQIVNYEVIELQPDYFGSVSAEETSTSFGVLLVTFILLMSLAGAIVYLVQRHRRMQNSFGRFANSHYDTKTGATRIGDTLEDEHDQHSQEVPPTFDDDVPLV